MFHLYFGAFDIVLYLAGTYFAMVLAKAICEEPSAADVRTSQSLATKQQQPEATVTGIKRTLPAKSETQPVTVRG